MTQVVSIANAINADTDVGVHSCSCGQVCGAHNLLPRNV